MPRSGACLRLGADPERASTISRASNSYAYHACGQLGAGSELLSNLGSYGDTLSDEDVLAFLKEYNSGRSIIVDVICSVDHEQAPRMSLLTTRSSMPSGGWALFRR
jgi:hypothetical protein